MSTKVILLDLADTVRPVSLEPEQDVLRVLVRLKRQVLGWVTLSASPTKKSIISAERLSNEIVHQLSWKVVEQHIGNTLDIPWRKTYKALSEPVSVILCTLGNTARLQRTLQSLEELDYPNYEVIVVQATSENATAAQVAKGRSVQFVRVDGGLNAVRNKGIEKAKHGIIAFLDDGSVVDALWMQSLSDGFVPGIAALTGYVAPTGWEEDAKRFAAAHFLSVRNKFHRQVFRISDGTDQEISRPGNFGWGGNMAFRREAFTSFGLFDEALDGGNWNDDSGADEMFYRLLKNRALLAYEPSMLTWWTP